MRAPGARYSHNVKNITSLGTCLGCASNVLGPSLTGLLFGNNWQATTLSECRAMPQASRRD